MVKIAEHPNELHWGSNDIAVINLHGKKICVARFNEGLFAFSYKCPHASGVMADGYLDALGNVVCPLHRYKFDLRNGRNVSGEGYFLKCWKIDHTEEGVFIDY